MKFLKKTSDGGKDSGVTAYFLVEWKSGFSIALLKFNKGSREAFHSHAFNALTWWLKGEVTEVLYPSMQKLNWKPSFFPKSTPKNNAHKILANQTSWALTLRGPWDKEWYEVKNNSKITLTHGREVVNTEIL